MANPIKPTIKSEFIPLALLILIIFASVFFYNNLPERIATHWNFAGEVDGWGSGQTQAIVFPLLTIGLYLLFLLIPYLDPKKERYEQFSKIYHIFKRKEKITQFAAGIICYFSRCGTRCAQTVLASKITNYTSRLIETI